jgi:hypothetical protein
MLAILIRGLIAVALTGFVTDAAFAGFISILNVDFNHGSPTTTAADANGVEFSSFDVSESLSKTFSGLSPSLTSGAVTVSVSNLYDGNFRDRGYSLFGGGTLSGAYRDLYRDFVPFAGPNSLAPALTLSGLNPDTDYTLTFQSFDAFSDHPGVTVYTDVTAGGATNGLTTTAYFTTSVDPSGSITDFGAPAGASATFTVRSNVLGQLVFAVGDPEGDLQNYNTHLNGFELSSAAAVVPEPASVALFGLGVGCLLGYRYCGRRRTCPGSA